MLTLPIPTPLDGEADGVSSPTANPYHNPQLYNSSVKTIEVEGNDNTLTDIDVLSSLTSNNVKTQKNSTEALILSPKANVAVGATSQDDAISNTTGRGNSSNTSSSSAPPPIPLKPKLKPFIQHYALNPSTANFPESRPESPSTTSDTLNRGINKLFHEIDLMMNSSTK